MDYEIYHHGIKGMRWGIRRYQRKDGSLTPAGKKHYRLDSQGNLVKKKALADMTDKEINEAIARKQLENRYTELYGKPKTKGAGLKKIGKEVLAPAALAAGKTAANAIMDKFAKTTLKKLGIDVESEYDRLKKEHDLLDIKSKIDKLKNPDADGMDRLEKAAKIAGYEKTIAEAEMKTRLNEQQRKKETKEADEAAREANEAASRREYERQGGTYSKTYRRSSGKTSESTSRTSEGETLSLPAPRTSNLTVNNGYKAAVDILDSIGGAVIGHTTYTEKD